jgi:hypothetical protein
MTQERQAEPPSTEQFPHFLIGQDRRGNWVVQDQSAVRGGIFVNRDAALRFIRFENSDRPQAVTVVPGVLELNMLGRSDITAGTASSANSQLLRQVA